MTALPYLLQGKNIVVIVDNKPHTITETNINYAKLKDAIISEDWDSVPDLVTPVKAIQKYVKGHFECVDGVIYEEGVAVHNALTNRIFSMYEDGFPIEPMLNFYKNIKLNPSKASADELYLFLEANSLPITEDGHFVAYKKVRKDYKDCYTGTMDNSVGKIVEMERKKVNSNRDVTCSTGLHFCSYEYLQHFGGDRIMIVKVNPMDTVSFPLDYSNSKGRCCKYEVIGEVAKELLDFDSLSLSGVSVYGYEFVEEDLDDEVKLDFSPTIHEVNDLGVRDLTQIWNELTGENLKKFSYRADANRRMFNSGRFTHQQIIDAAVKLKLA